MSHYSASDLSFMCSRFQQGLQAGLTPQKILASLGKRPAFRSFSQQVIESLNQGESLHQSFRPFANQFSTFFLAVLEAGELSGRLPEAFQNLASYFQQVEKAQRQLRAKLVPALLQVGMGFAVVLLTGLILFILGKGAVAWLALSGFVIVTLMLVSFVLIGKISPPELAAKIYRLVPGLGTVQHLAGLQRFCLVMGTTLDSTMPIERAVALSLEASEQVPKEIVETIAKKLKRGTELSVALGMCRDFPEELLGTIAVAEASGTLPEAMSRLSVQYQERLEDKLQLTARMASMGLAAMVAGSIIVAIFVLAQDYLNALNG
ncbi:MAG: type II secretion system F family protein [Gemmataceae bacterium]|jgi:type II secretory pathway component PulF|nr:type II secretion system F family protein [Gemmataceae bacterium]